MIPTKYNANKMLKIGYRLQPTTTKQAIQINTQIVHMYSSRY